MYKINIKYILKSIKKIKEIKEIKIKYSFFIYCEPLVVISSEY